MSFTGEIGRIGEQMVADWLKAKGYIILRRNFSGKQGEIDVIAESPKELVFVEVKTRKLDSMVAPADAVDLSKRKKLIRTAQEFIARSHLRSLPYRFDIAEVTYRLDADGEPRCSLNYIKNAFEPQ